jgi:hypothetical protein
MNIKTNHHQHPILSWFDLSAKEQKEFEYLDTEDRQLDASFFRYKGVTYDLGEFLVIPQHVATNTQFEGWEKWDGYSSDSFFSGVLVKYVEDIDDHVIVGTYFS